MSASGIPEGTRITVLASRFNEEIVAGLLEGALGWLAGAGLKDEQVRTVWVPGALELPVAAARLAKSGQVDGLVALGCVIRGETAHFEHVGRETVGGLSRVALETGIPVGIGVLTVDSVEQARVRAGLDPDPSGSKERGDRHRGREAAAACLEMVALFAGSSGIGDRDG